MSITTEGPSNMTPFEWKDLLMRNTGNSTFKRLKTWEGLKKEMQQQMAFGKTGYIQLAPF